LRVKILSERLVTQNTRAFLLPILSNLDRLRDRGVDVSCQFEPDEGLADCDAVLINSKYWSGSWDSNRDRALELLAELSDKVPRVYYFDRSSTSAQIIPDIFPFVAKYYKTNLLRDRSAYLAPIYGARYFSQYYHEELGIEDSPAQHSFYLTDENQLGKLAVSWNTGLANYTLLGPRWTSFYNIVPSDIFLRYPTRFLPPSLNRPIAVSCRMGLSYKYKTVEYQRRGIAEILKDHRRTDRVSKWRYFDELKKSKIVASPFGYSEINYKDFETFLCGALLFKPDMSHLETYPSFYVENGTYVAHSWLLDDVESKLEEILDNYDAYLDIARQGQETYRRHITSSAAWDEFADRFVELVASG